jgi:ribulose-phosphate 3-epimerase
MFPDLTAAIRKLTARPLHVHLMVADGILLEQIAQFADAGADLISIHRENGNLDEGLALIEGRGLRAGLVAQLHTPVSAFTRYLGGISILTLLGTRIGVKGQDLDPAAAVRLRAAGSLIAQHSGGRRILLAADGGIREHTVPILRQAGAETIVIGSLAFGAPDLASRMQWVSSQGRA